MAKKEIILAYEEDIHLWGINSNLEDYRLCWYINETLYWKMKRINDVNFYNPKSKTVQYYSAYKFENEIDFYDAELIQNKRAGNYLLPEMKSFDYVFLLKGELAYFDTDAFEQQLSQISGIQLVYKVDLDKIKSRKNLLLRHFNEA
ncbi:MAG: IPExxxVDY family protein [Chitinophagales bacterium]|nr:IPExxxVDY family protein [Chitinophagales bacterium]